MATPINKVSLGGLALRLVQKGLLDEDRAEKLQKSASKERRSFFVEVLENKDIDSKELTRQASEEFGVPLLDINSIDVDSAPIRLLKDTLIEKHRILPIYKRGAKIFIALSDPTNTHALDEVKFHTGLGVEPVLVEFQQLDKAIDQALEANDDTFEGLGGGEGLEDIDISAEESQDGRDIVTDIEQIDTPIVRFVNKILLDAIKKGASDIHMEPYEKKFRIRFRVDGVLHEITNPPVNLAGRIVARVKILSRLDIAERRAPQDGRMKLRLSKNKSIDFRVSTLPTLHGEKCVIRILDSNAELFGIEALGFEEDQKKLYLEAVERPYGMILVTGPTGSGKTVTLYTALGMLNNSERNISTVEDPVEINLMGINQVTINEKANLTFAAALRAFLRQDPDVIMVGEIRDLETADIAIKASQTGHLVLSTLHTNDAPSSLTRLLNMGVAPFNVASTVHLIMAQRLVRKLCSACKKEIKIPEQAMVAAGFQEDELDTLTLYQPVGCDSCTRGFKGRVGIFQVMPVSHDMGSLIMRGCTEIDIAELARDEGVSDLRRSGLNKVKSGITSLEEIERVTNI
ncbi:type IV-A pilus assembly ATPase PilB [Pseudomonadota bacterium]